MLNNFIIAGKVWYFDSLDKVLHVKINIGTANEFIMPILTAGIIYPNNYEKNIFVIIRGHLDTSNFSLGVLAVAEKIMIVSNVLEEE